VGTRTALKSALAEIRAQGDATSQEESEEGVSSIAVAQHSTRSAHRTLVLVCRRRRFEQHHVVHVVPFSGGARPLFGAEGLPGAGGSLTIEGADGDD